MNESVHIKKRGRPAGSKTRFRGLLAFARLNGVTPLHAHMVLCGRRESRRLSAAWETFEAGKSA